jgi:hypothetical protein
MTARLVNTCTRPVELHLTDGVVVVPAMSQIDCPPADLDLVQVTVLCRHGVLVAYPPESEPSPEPPASPAPARRRPSSPRKRKS